MVQSINVKPRLCVHRNMWGYQSFQFCILVIFSSCNICAYDLVLVVRWILSGWIHIFYILSFSCIKTQRNWKVFCDIFINENHGLSKIIKEDIFCDKDTELPFVIFNWWAVDVKLPFKPFWHPISRIQKWCSLAIFDPENGVITTNVCNVSEA